MNLLKNFSVAGSRLLAWSVFIVLVSGTQSVMAKPDIRALRVKPVAFSTLPGWKRDDHAQAFAAFLRSCKKMNRRGDTLAKACRMAKRLPHNISDHRARAFFESYFAPHKVRSGRRGLLTGYYEPELFGSRVRTKKFNIPIYRRPADLVGLHSRRMRRAARRAGLPRSMTYAKRTRYGLKRYMTREQIERGGLKGRKLELLWLADPVEAFFLHIQGSGRIVLPDGSRMRIGFDGKNGYDYSSVGKALVRSGLMPASKVSLENVKSWLRKNPRMGRKAMWRNKSFIFFRELSAHAESKGPIGAQGISLIGGRSLAVDRRHYRLGLPIFLSVPNFHKDGHANLRRLMIAQDTGTAIKGAKRGDIFWGSGDKAGDIAGRTYHKGDFFVLLPRRRPLAIKASHIERQPVVQPALQKHFPSFAASGSHAFSRFKSQSY
jgi:membrane-bound lytic murein transglycosylase A